MFRNVIEKIARTVKHFRAIDELLETLAEEMSKTANLERELKLEREHRRKIEERLAEVEVLLKEKEGELKSLKMEVSKLEQELTSILEASLLRYLRESGGKLPIKEYVEEHGTTEERVLGALKALKRKGLIKIE